MSETNVDLELAREANRRYWQSDASVNQIAEAMGLSKSSLYGLIDRLPTGLACPECGGELEFPNRTARDRGLVTCPDCDYEGSAEEMLDAAEAEPESGGRAPRRISTSAKRVIAGTALLGVAAGLIIGTLARRR